MGVETYMGEELIMKHMNHLRYKSSWIDLMGDGRFPEERIKGKTKRYLRKWTLRKQRKLMEE